MKVFRFTHFLLVLVALPQSRAYAVEFNSLLADKSTLTFNYTQMGVPMEGSFARFNAAVLFDSANLARSRATIKIDSASIDTGSDEVNDEVVGKLWFDSKTYPVAQFVSTGVRPLGSNRYEVGGNLTIKGRTRAVKAPFTFTPQSGYAVLDGAFTLNRLDFAIGDGAWRDVSAVANEIKIKFHFVLGSKNRSIP